MLIYIFYYQDALENLFSQIKGKNYQSNNPSAQEFSLIIRQILVDSLITHNREAHCEEEIDFLVIINFYIHIYIYLNFH